MIFTNQDRSYRCVTLSEVSRSPERSEGEGSGSSAQRCFAATSRSFPLSEAKGSGLRLTQHDIPGFGCYISSSQSLDTSGYLPPRQDAYNAHPYTGLFCETTLCACGCQATYTSHVRVYETT